MTPIFALITQQMTFLTILGAGLVYILTTSILGQFFGGHDGTHDGGHDGHDNDSSHSTISIFSPKIIAIFMVGFGAAGTLSTHYGADVVIGTLVGVLGGGALGGLAFLGLRLLYSQQASSDIHISDAQGLTGSVLIDVPAVGAGEVGLSVRGQYLTYFARSQGIPIPRQTRVTVQSVDGNTLVVSPLV